MMKGIMILLAAMAVLITFGFSSIEAQDTVKIGYLTPLTGPGSLFGLTGREGFTLGVEDVNARGGINGKKLEPIVYDSQSKPTVAATLAQRLMLEDKVPLIVVASGSVDVLAIMEVTERAKIPVFVCGSSSPVITEKGFKWVWRRSFNDKVCAEIIGKYVSSKPDWKRIAILSENSLYFPTYSFLVRLLYFRPQPWHSWSDFSFDDVGQSPSAHLLPGVMLHGVD